MPSGQSPPAYHGARATPASGSFVSEASPQVSCGGEPVYGSVDWDDSKRVATWKPRDVEIWDTGARLELTVHPTEVRSDKGRMREPLVVRYSVDFPEIKINAACPSLLQVQRSAACASAAPPVRGSKCTVLSVAIQGKVAVAVRSCSLKELRESVAGQLRLDPFLVERLLLGDTHLSNNIKVAQLVSGTLRFSLQPPARSPQCSSVWRREHDHSTPGHRGGQVRRKKGRVCLVQLPLLLQARDGSQLQLLPAQALSTPAAHRRR